MNFLTKHGTHNSPVLKIVAAVLFITFPIIGFVMGMQFQDIGNNYLPSSIPTSKTLVSSKETKNKINYVRRNINLSKKIFNQFNYPTEITNVPDNELIPLSCGAKDEIILTPYSRSVNISLNNIRNSQLCLREEGSGIWLISTIGVQNSAEDNFVYIVDSYQSKATKLTSIKLDGYVCSDILQIDKKDTVYLECGWGDGGGLIKQIVKVDLKTGEYNKILECSAINSKEPECEKI